MAHHDETGVVGRSIPCDERPQGAGDEYDLRRRFCATHARDFNTALEEIRHGKKQSCWSWYIFPTAPWVVNGAERGSGTNSHYALRDKPPHRLRGDDAARAYLKFEADGVNLRRNYLDMMVAVAEQVEGGVPPVRLVGVLDDPKLRSSLRLFERISREGFDDEVNEVCRRALKALSEEWMSDDGGKQVKFTGGENVTLLKEEGTMLLVKAPNGDEAQVPKSNCVKQETTCCAGCSVQ